MNEELKIGALIYSRLSSSRFPKKALAFLGENTVLDWCISGAKELAECKVIVATSNEVEDDELAELAQNRGVESFQGDLNNVAMRTIACCEKFELDYFFRINGDSPFLNLLLMKQALDILKDNKYDLISNLIPRSYPYGMSCELVKVDSFKKVYHHFDESQKEHITSYYYTNPEQFNIAALPVLSHDYSKIRLTVDTPYDLEILSKWQKTKDPKELYHLDPANFGKELEELKKKKK